MVGNIKNDQWMSISGLGESINGDNVVSFVAPSRAKGIEGFADFTNVMTYMTDGDDRKQMEKYLGFFELFATTHEEKRPMLANIVKDMAVVVVEDSEVVTYDIAIPSNAKRCATALTDTSGQTDVIVPDQVFYIILDRKFAPGAYIKYDLTSSIQVTVSKDHDIEPVGEGYKHYVTFASGNKKQEFPKNALRAGQEWTYIAHPIAEYGTQWGNLHVGNEAGGKLRMQAKLPSPQGIEVAYSMRGGNITNHRLGDSMTSDTKEHLMTEMEKLGGFDARGVMLLGQGNLQTGAYKRGSIKASSALEYLAVKELLIRQAHSNMFAEQNEEATEDGVIRVNQGAWGQHRRGKIITYPRIGALGLKHLQEASAYMFGNSNVPVENRRIVFTGGYEACTQGWELLSKHGHDILNRTSSMFIGTNGLGVADKLVTGSIDNLKVHNYRIGEVFLPTIGYVSFEHDPSFDYQPIGDRINSGYTTNGYQKLSGSLMVKSASVNKSNTIKGLDGANLINGGNKKSNFYFMKPENHIWWGKTYGRMNDGDKYRNLNASLKYMGNEFWAATQSSILMVDTTGSVIIEVQDTFEY